MIKYIYIIIYMYLYNNNNNNNFLDSLIFKLYNYYHKKICLLKSLKKKLRFNVYYLIYFIYIIKLKLNYMM